MKQIALSTKMASFLTKARKSQNLSQQQVAQRLGYSSPQFISNWERGLASPPMNVLKRLVQLYKIDAEVLYNMILEDVQISLQTQLGIKKKAY